MIDKPFELKERTPEAREAYMQGWYAGKRAEADYQARIREEGKIRMPVQFLLRLADQLQYVDTEGYGLGLTAEQVRNAESIIKGFVIATVDALEPSPDNPST